MDPVHDRGSTTGGSMDPVHESGPWTRSKVGVHGPLVHVSSSPLHIPIEHADDVNKLFVIPRVVVSSAILSLLSASLPQQYTMKRLPRALSI